MGKVRFSIALSLDGYMAGPRQSVQDPLGVGGPQLHAWALELEAFRRMHGMEGGVRNASTELIERMFEGAGAVVMGRNMFGGQPGPWEEGPGAWRGWWGEDPPYHLPVFVVTHHPRAPLAMQGGTTFEFVTHGIGAALGRAQEAAGGRDVVLGGGASLIRQCLAAGLVDQVGVSLVPVLLGAGERPFDALGDAGLRLAQERAIEAPGVTHLRYRVVR
jgi:dihydrofolate reductase